jgi:hypothetical protein
MKQRTREQRLEQEAKLAALGLRCTITYLGRFQESPFPLASTDEKPWQHFKWACSFERLDGTGHKRPAVVLPWYCGIAHQTSMGDPVKPDMCEVLHVIARDYTYAREFSFKPWCEYLGYNSDSISHRKVYDQCLEHGEALLTHTTPANLRIAVGWEF